MSLENKLKVLDLIHEEFTDRDVRAAVWGFVEDGRDCRKIIDTIAFYNSDVVLQTLGKIHEFAIQMGLVEPAEEPSEPTSFPCLECGTLYDSFEAADNCPPCEALQVEEERSRLA